MNRQELLKTAKPIIFNTEMVQAILNERKTVTRRIIKQKYVDDVLSSPARMENLNIPSEKFIELLVDAPYQKGDYLYVRETWIDDYTQVMFDENDEIQYIYKADMKLHLDGYEQKVLDMDDQPRNWKPSIHMPKVAARIFLKVTNVYVEKIDDITTEKAIKEGFNSLDDFSKMFFEIYPKADGDTWVWVIEFERVEVEA